MDTVVAQLIKISGSAYRPRQFFFVLYSDVFAYQDIPDFSGSLLFQITDLVDLFSAL